MAARWLGMEVAMSMNLMRFISRSQLTRPTSVVYGEGAADDEDGDAMARAAAGEGEALAQEKLRRAAAAAASGWVGSAGSPKPISMARPRRPPPHPAHCLPRQAWPRGVEMKTAGSEQRRGYLREAKKALEVEIFTATVTSRVK